MVSFTLFRRIVIQKDLMKTKLLIVIGLVALCSAYVPSFGYTSGNTRVSPDTAITRTNVNTLKLKWSFQLDGPSLASAVTGVIGNRDIIFLPTFTGWLYAIVRTSGQLLWKKPLSTYTGKSFSIARSTCAVYGQVVVFGSQTGCELIAVNGTNGNKIWTKVLDTHPYCIITQSPTSMFGSFFTD
jgi:polyvinyl alcohol dehydrogenase (cytochrome)